MAEGVVEGVSVAEGRAVFVGASVAVGSGDEQVAMLAAMTIRRIIDRIKTACEIIY